MQGFSGTVTHCAPEALAGSGALSTAVDVYSFGIVMWELISAAPLYLGLSMCAKPRTSPHFTNPTACGSSSA